MQERRSKGQVRERRNRYERKTGYEITILCFGIVELLSSSLDRAFLPAITAVSSQATAGVGAVTVTITVKRVTGAGAVIAVTAVIAVEVVNCKGKETRQDKTPLHRLQHEQLSIAAINA